MARGVATDKELELIILEYHRGKSMHRIANKNNGSIENAGKSLKDPRMISDQSQRNLVKIYVRIRDALP